MHSATSEMIFTSNMFYYSTGLDANSAELIPTTSDDGILMPPPPPPQAMPLPPDAPEWARRIKCCEVRNKLCHLSLPYNIHV